MYLYHLHGEAMESIMPLFRLRHVSFVEIFTDAENVPLVDIDTFRFKFIHVLFEES